VAGKLSDEELLVLHRHWMWANIMRENFDAELRKNQGDPKGDTRIADYQGAYMCLWYGMLYGVLEVVEREKVIIPGLGDKDSIVGPLRQFRNAVFHPQKKYWSKKLFEIMKDKDSAIKIRKVHSALGRYFLEEMQRRARKS